MPIDVDRIIRAAAEAVLEGHHADPGRQGKQGSKRKLLTAPRALLVGAGVFTAGKLLVRGRGLTEDLQQRLSDYERRYLGGDDEEDAGEDFDENEDLEADGDDEPRGDYDDDEPEGEFDEEEEPEGEYDGEEEPEDEYDEEEEPEDEEEEEPRSSSRASSAAGRRNGRH